MAWRVAKSLETLRAQVNILAPNRSKKADGTIGDTAHSARTSDHNPNSSNVVTAIDLTHDPANGADMAQISESLRLSRDSRIKYVIFAGRYFSPKTNWQWRPYTGPNAHKQHMHVSVQGQAHLWDNPAKWAIQGGGVDVALNDKEEAHVRGILGVLTVQDAKDLRAILDSMRRVGSNPTFIETIIKDHREEEAAGEI